MATEQFANGAQTTLNGGVTAGASSIAVAAATGFPSSARFRIRIDSELLLVTGGAGTTTWNVSRGIEGTTAAAHSDKAVVTSVLTAGALESATWKSPCRAATAAALPTNTRTGNVLTALANGALSAIDGVTLALKDRLLVKNEATGANNGLYYVSDLGSVSTPWTLTRSADASEDPEVVAGTVVAIEEGTTNADTLWMLTTDNPITLNTTSLTFATIVGGGGGAPTDATYVVEDAHSGLSAEKVLGSTVITSTDYASRQAAAKAGRLFLPNDGIQIERDSGSAWSPWGPIWPLTPVIDGDFAWINQGGATVTTAKGITYISAPANAGISVRIRKKAAPSTPYSITVGFLPVMPPVTFGGATVGWRQSSDGKLVVVGTAQEDGFGIHKLNSATSYNSSYVNGKQMTRGPIQWIRIRDDGTNRIVYVSADGLNWLQVHSVGRTDFMTADEVLFSADSNNATYGAGISMLHWKES